MENVTGMFRRISSSVRRAMPGTSQEPQHPIPAEPVQEVKGRLETNDLRQLRLDYEQKTHGKFMTGDDDLTLSYMDEYFKILLVEANRRNDITHLKDIRGLFDELSMSTYAATRQFFYNYTSPQDENYLRPGRYVYDNRGAGVVSVKPYYVFESVAEILNQIAPKYAEATRQRIKQALAENAPVEINGPSTVHLSNLDRLKTNRARILRYEFDQAVPGAFINGNDEIVTQPMEVYFRELLNEAKTTNDTDYLDDIALLLEEVKETPYATERKFYLKNHHDASDYLDSAKIVRTRDTPGIYSIDPIPVTEITEQIITQIFRSRLQKLKHK